MQEEWISKLTYAQAEALYRNGSLSQVEWEAYCHAWRNSAFRFSSLALGYQDKRDEED